MFLADTSDNGQKTNLADIDDLCINLDETTAIHPEVKAKINSITLNRFERSHNDAPGS